MQQKQVLSTQNLKVNDPIHFSCNGRGRGGHYTVWATVTKVNRKTVAATERDGSYRPGTRWKISVDFDNPVYLETK